MIDQQLIDRGIAHARVSLSRAVSTPCEWLLRVEDFLPCEILSKVDKFAKHPSAQAWLQVENQEHMPRDRVSWASDTVIEELHEIHAALTPDINRLFPLPIKHFWGVSLWRDSGGYDISWHRDNPDIDVAIQIYLSATGPAPGTDFEINGSIYPIDFVTNCGYISCNSFDRGLPHCTAFPVPNNTMRYSLYAVWSRFPKKAANT